MEQALGRKYLFTLVTAVLIAGCTPSAKADPEFDSGISGYAGDMKTLAPLKEGDNLRVIEVDDGKGIEARGPVQLIGIKEIEVDPKKSYRVGVRLRVTKNDPTLKGALTHVGVATFDKDGKELTAAPGTYRYAALANALLSQADGWQEFEGIIQGEGNQNYNQFRPGTASVRPVALLNYGGNEAVTEIDYLRVEEVK